MKKKATKARSTGEERPTKARAAASTKRSPAAKTAKSGSRDPRVDAYVANAPEYARPILERVREAVHAGCPDVVETIKWRMPSFEYMGMLAGMAAFKAHCVVGFWKHELLIDVDERAKEAMGSFGCVRTVDDLPPRAEFVALVKRARKLNEDGVKAPRTKTVRQGVVAVHPEFETALSRNAKARATLDGFSPSQRREYVEWIADAKKDDTRARRIETAVEWLAAGKTRNWKYQRG